MKAHPVRRSLGAVLLAGLALSSLVGCTKDDETTPAAADTPAVTTTSVAPPPPPPPPVLWPLTGRESGAVPPHPALAVKIENSLDARPQSQLNSADLVWEEVV